VSNSADFSYCGATVPPGAIFVAGDHEVSLYPSAKAAEQALNPVYAENGRYPVAYGIQGERYQVARNGRRVTIRRTGEPDSPDELRQLLLRYLQHIHQAADESQSLPNLIERVWRSESEFWKLNDPYGERFGTRMPWWGCVGFILIIGLIIYAVLR